MNSNGPAAIHGQSSMGVYRLTGKTFNNFPVYQTAGGQFLYVSKDDRNNLHWSTNRYVYCMKMMFSTLFVLVGLLTISNLNRVFSNPI